MAKKKKTKYIKLDDAVLTIQNMIRSIQMCDYGTDAGIPQLYMAIDNLKLLPVFVGDGGDDIH